MTFKGGGGGGYECFGLGKSFVPKPLLIEFFSSDIQRRCMSGISMQDFFPQNQSVGYFFLKSPILRLKSQMVGPLAALRLLFVSLSSKKIPGILRVCCQKPIGVTYVSLSTKTISKHLISSAKRTLRTAANIIII